jgi:hypothetical protein
MLAHYLLKLYFQPGRPPRGWLRDILNEQQEIRQMLARRPSLGAHAPRLLAEAYPDAVSRAAAEAGIPPTDFPAEPPWTFDEALGFTRELPPAPRHRARKR